MGFCIYVFKMFCMWLLLCGIIKSVEMSRPFNVTARIKLPSAEAAHILKASLDVDEELQPGRVTRELATEGSTLIV